MKAGFMYFLLWISVYFSPVYPLILSIGFFVVCDAITAIIAAKKKGEPFTSRKLRDSVAKFLQYGIAIFVAHVVEQQFLPQFPALKVISGFIAYIELKSMNENFEKSTGTNIFKLLLQKIKLK